MSNVIKQYMRDELVREIRGLESFVVVQYQGLDSEQTLNLRHDVRGKRLRMRMVRNRLARIAFEELGIHGLAPYMTGPSALISGSDPIELTKAVTGFQKSTGEKLSVKGAWIQGQALDGDAVQRLSQTPPREVLLARIIGAIQSPVTRIVRSITAPVQNLARLINAVAEQKKQQGQAG